MPNGTLTTIDHVVVLAFENRSFDHLLGFHKSSEYAIDGLNGDESNPENPSDPMSGTVSVSPDAPTGPDLSPTPNHDLRDVRVQLYGTSETPSPGVLATNCGFVYDYGQITGNAGPASHRIMRCFAPGTLPALSQLVKEFAVCDHWHASVPGPTWPNRFFLHAATSDGYVDNNPRPYSMRTIYRSLSDAGLSWKIYFHDFPQSLAMQDVRGAIANVRLSEEEFAADCANGTLPTYSFIEPRYFDFLWLKANDQHPPHDVLPGDHLLADVYEHLRASPLWERTALIVLWDEHGGIYDHVPPPRAVNPDGKSTPEFAFDQLGVRVPALIVSPLVPRGTIDHTLYEHASVPAFVKNVFGLPNFLTRRDAAANTFESVLSLGVARTDAPEKLDRAASGGSVGPTSHTLRALSAEAVLAAKAAGQPSTASTSDLQNSLVALSQDLPVVETPLLRAVHLATRTATEHDAAVRVLSVAARFFGL